ncbi:acyltransferase [Gordonia sp. X0973]|uniref:acyltransferase family protein n=1 Tax=Gordonia sp. X0973 TaxID=2742602 RepID=UPI000F528D78|nr:acyltransferase [Gordonia sp. X0973]QKT08977.1 acyltransferase [Gordonia sp. X0973]
MAARVPALTGIRTLAALSVCLTHAAFWTGHYADTYVGRLNARFEVGVTIFFVLSGYLLYRGWVRVLRAGPDTRPVSVRTYFAHRARRILPAYWLTVVGVYLLYLFRKDPNDIGHGWDGFARNMTFTQLFGMGHQHTGLTQMWSMVAEVAFYLVLPVVALVGSAISRRRWRPDLLLCLLGAVALVSPIWIFAVVGGDVDPTMRLWPPTFLWWFVAGMVLAVCEPLMTRVRTRWWVGAGVVAFLVAGGSGAGGATMAPETAGQTVVKHVLYLVVSLGFIVPLIGVGDDHAAPDWWARLWSGRVAVWFGEISYEFFCVHVVVLEIVMGLLGYRVFTGSMWLAFLVTTVIATPLAWLLHRVTRPIWRRNAAA